MKPIGGYFELELPQRSEYHSTAIALNTGRNCMEYILRARGYRRVYLPCYSCEVLLEPFNKLGVDYTFYHINECLELEEEIQLSDGDAILYINYFGLKQSYVKKLEQQYGKRLIVDNTQAFYSMPADGIDTFYSCRKFFGVPDGAYLYCDQQLDMDMVQDQSWERMGYLLKRIDLSAEAAYADFRVQSAELCNNLIKTMSQLTHRIMASIDYCQVAQRRRDNYRVLDEGLNDKNRISLPFADNAVPMVYPFLTDDDGLRQRLIENKIFVAQYWPNVLDWCEKGCTDHQLTKQLLPLPVDQRYNENDMHEILYLLANIRKS
jgi:hypothetical protein